MAVSTPNLGSGLAHRGARDARAGLDAIQQSVTSRSSSAESAIAAASGDGRSPLDTLHDSLMEQLSRSESQSRSTPTVTEHPRLNRQRQSRVPRHVGTPETMLPNITADTVADRLRPEATVADRTRRRRQLDDQENSEEAAMSVFAGDVAALQVQRQEPGEVMNTTPPRATRVSRFL
jgi:hypothetical protein